jgi:hypothetical protein
MAKSLLRSPTKLCVERAVNSHDCQANGRHRIRGGDKRLKVFTDPRSPDHYCADCARKILQGDLARLTALLGEIEA